VRGIGILRTSYRVLSAKFGNKVVINTAFE
jgi:hypothetical protein